MKQGLDKIKLREQLRNRRQQFVKTASLEAALNDIYRNYISLNLLPQSSIVGGYWATGSEASLLYLLTALHQQGHITTLPKVRAVDQLMEFKLWTPTCDMEPDIFGISAPLSEKNYLPELLFVPVLGFDEACGRLGQGLGFYDKFIEIQKVKKPLLTVGIAFEVQKVSQIPLELHDQKLDYIVTEKMVYHSM